jgi:hypothetical protein
LVIQCGGINAQASAGIATGEIGEAIALIYFKSGGIKQTEAFCIGISSERINVA